MCGIAGFLSRQEFSDDYWINNLQAMASSLIHRGPDEEGIWFDRSQGIGFSHRRLSILDLTETGNQPMHSACNNYVITFNGEIYNHLKIRKKLKEQNLINHWKGTSDTETFLAAFSSWGIKKTLEESRGMFAFSLWDKRKKELILGRDRFGEKPLYYGWNGNIFLFGSELKALKSHVSFIEEIDKEALSLYLQNSYVPCPRSIYKNIKKLEPSTIAKISFNSNQVKKENFWDLENTLDNSKSNLYSSKAEAVKDLDNLLNEVVEEQMISDAPLGGFLSGGIDSSLILSIMQSQSSKPIKSFTIGFTEKEFDESTYASNVAKYLGTEHTELIVSSSDLLSVVPKLSKIYDEPFADSSQVPTFLLSSLASNKVKVSLSGDGGDEIFAGYNRHRFVNNTWPKLNYVPLKLRKSFAEKIIGLSPEEIRKLIKFLPISSHKQNNLGGLLIKIANVIGADNITEYYENLIYQTDKPSEILHEKNQPYEIGRKNNSKLDIGSYSDLEKVMIMDTINYLPDDILVKVDRASMSVSLETRAPFLDPRVFKYAWSLPSGLKINGSKTKFILREVLSNYIPKKMIERPKKGFGIPLDDWLRGPLRDWADALLNKELINSEGLLNANTVQKIWHDHVKGKANRGPLLWNILMFQLWLKDK
ncbi:MAG: asparagine synthase (glutamine-hydrolyzing) [Candidatus Marinimicrobia bacterium]|nr:asparagine synthase (glutamine-hydrolyzing) [Candidatus Neomarinimicrobiota bacterium]|tara:strand:+ start:9394 stop:11337 length:1944 start_codon:yes stop_codon:yes gene_type:complete